MSARVEGLGGGRRQALTLHPLSVQPGIAEEIAGWEPPSFPINGKVRLAAQRRPKLRNARRAQRSSPGPYLWRGQILKDKGVKSGKGMGAILRTLKEAWKASR